MRKNLKTHAPGKCLSKQELLVHKLRENKNSKQIAGVTCEINQMTARLSELRGSISLSKSGINDLLKKIGHDVEPRCFISLQAALRILRKELNCWEPNFHR